MWYLGRMLLLVLACSLAQIGAQDVMYTAPMMLGRTYDLSQSNVGAEIFPLNAPTQDIQMASTTLVSRVVKTAKDIHDVLDVSGQLSLKMGMGLVNIKGSGSYMKSTSSNEKTVKILTKITYKTISRTLLSDSQPHRNWPRRQNVVGRHYVRAITYGGELIAVITFKTAEVAEKEEVEAALEAGVRVGGVFDAKVEGRFKQLIQEISRKSDVKISLFSTAEIKKQPDSLETFLEAINDFPNQMKKTENGIGIPIMAHLAPLSQVPGATPNHQFKIERQFIIDMDKMVEYYNDVIYTINAIDMYAKKQHCPLPAETEASLNDLQKTLLRINRELVSEMVSLDINGLTAREAHRKKLKLARIYFGKPTPGSSMMPWKYMRKFKSIVKFERSQSQMVSTLNGIMALGDFLTWWRIAFLWSRMSQFEKCYKHTFEETKLQEIFEKRQTYHWSFASSLAKYTFEAPTTVTVRGRTTEEYHGYYPIMDKEGLAHYQSPGMYIVTQQFKTKLTQRHGRFKVVMGVGTLVNEEEDKKQCPAITKTVGNVGLLAVPNNRESVRLSPQLVQGMVEGEDTFISSWLLMPAPED